MLFHFPTPPLPSALLSFGLMAALMALGLGLRLHSLKALAVLWLVHGIGGLYATFTVVMVCLLCLTALVLALMAAAVRKSKMMGKKATIRSLKKSRFSHGHV